MIFYRKGLRKVTKKGVEVYYDIDKKIDFSVFPGLQVSHKATHSCMWFLVGVACHEDRACSSPGICWLAFH